MKRWIAFGWISTAIFGTAAFMNWQYRPYPEWMWPAVCNLILAATLWAILYLTSSVVDQ